MAENSKIEWTDHTFNPWHGCTKVSPGCKNCYAERDDNRFTPKGTPRHWGPEAPRRFFPDKHWKNPLKWDKKAAELGVRYKVFCGSMCDVFEDREDLHVHRNRLYELIQDTPNLDWLLLTKRPERVNVEWPWKYQGYILENIWMGTSVENQGQEHRIVELQKIPARVRFLSLEPLLGPVDLRHWLSPCSYYCDHGGMWPEGHRPGKPGIDWVIAGGESGTKARPMHPAWARSIRDQCAEAGVPFFFKQWGAWITPKADFWTIGASNPYKGNPEHNWSLSPKDKEAVAYKVGKKAAGRLLDGREWSEFPLSHRTPKTRIDTI